MKHFNEFNDFKGESKKGLEKPNNYAEYLAENLDKSIKFNEYLAENLDKSMNYAEYVAENIDKSIGYTTDNWIEDYAKQHDYGTSGFAGPTGIAGTSGIAGQIGIDAYTGATYDNSWKSPSSNVTYTPTTGNVYETYRSRIPVKLSFIGRIQKIIREWNDIQ